MIVRSGRAKPTTFIASRSPPLFHSLFSICRRRSGKWMALNSRSLIANNLCQDQDSRLAAKVQRIYARVQIALKMVKEIKVVDHLERRYKNKFTNT